MRPTRLLIGWPACWSSWPAAPSSPTRPWSARLLPAQITTLAADLPERILGTPVESDRAAELIRAVGASVELDDGTAHRHRAELAARPARPVRLCRGGRPAGRLRHDRGGRPPGSGRAGPDPRPAGPAGRQRRAWPPPVSWRCSASRSPPSRRSGQARAARRRPAAAAGARPQPAGRDQPVPADDDPARAVRRGRPQHESRQRRPCPVRVRSGLPRPRPLVAAPRPRRRTDVRRRTYSMRWTMRCPISRGTVPSC